MKKILMMLALLIAMPALAQNKVSALAIGIHTGPLCESCKKLLETELVYEKGVKAVEVDVDREMIKIDFDRSKTDVMKLHTAISKLGFAADNTPPMMEARKNLPACCVKDGCGLPVKK